MMLKLEVKLTISPQPSLSFILFLSIIHHTESKHTFSEWKKKPGTSDDLENRNIFFYYPLFCVNLFVTSQVDTHDFDYDCTLCHLSFIPKSVIVVPHSIAVSCNFTNYSSFFYYHFVFFAPVTPSKYHDNSPTMTNITTNITTTYYTTTTTTINVDAITSTYFC